MADINNFGIDFPFSDSTNGKYLKMTNTSSKEVRAALIHLLLTRKGSRYYLPSFGTKLYDHIFEPMDESTFSKIQQDVDESVKEFLPQLTVNSIKVTPYLETEESPGEFTTGLDERLYRVAAKGTEEYTAKLRIDYTNIIGQFPERDYILINI